MIRAATTADLVLLPEIEVSAGELFRRVGMVAVADDPPPTVAELQPYLRAGRMWVAVEDGRVVGYATAAVVDGCAHVEQVSVDPGWARRRLGAALVDEVGRWGAGHALPWLTLTTFASVAWNGPYYRRLGFEEIPDAEVGPQLRAIRRRESALGFDEWPRIAMRRRLPRPD